METTLNKQGKVIFTDKTKGIIVDIIIYLFVALFVYTAASKFSTMESFKIILSRSPLTGNYSTFIAWSAPIIESIIVLFLLIPSTKKIGLYASLFLMILFTSFLLYGILSGSTLPCHCGGVISSMSWQEHVLFNIGSIVLAIMAIVLTRK